MSEVLVACVEMRRKLYSELEMEPTQKAIDETIDKRDALETQIGANLSKLAPQDLVSIGWIVEELLDQSTY